jgi:phosphoribulokinase
MFSELPFIHYAGNNVSKIELQYRRMPFVDWKEEAPFKKNGLPVDTEQFLIGVLQYKAFKKLATFVITCLITPLSNAVVERIFSLLSSVTTKTRHRMQLNLLDAIVSVRAEQLLSIECCKDFTASPEILKNFT